MPTIVAILIVLGAGVFIGGRLEGAHDAHEHFSSYRARTVKGLGGWIKNIFLTGVGIAAFVLMLHVLVSDIHVH